MAEPNRFPMPDNNLALLDIDKTLVDVRYQITDERLVPEIARTQEEGWVVGLSSDTPHEKLISQKLRFSTNGPIIAERGAVVEWDGALHYDESSAAAFCETRDSAAHELADRGFKIVHAYPGEQTEDEREAWTPGDEVIFVNPFRICSVGLWAFRFVNQGGLVIDDDLTTNMSEIVRPHMPDMDLFWDLNHEYGILIAAPNSVNKRVGTQKFTEFAGVSGRVAMVGDSMSDYLGNDVAAHYAVGNAHPDFKAVADYVASKPISSGSIEILQNLRSNS